VTTGELIDRLVGDLAPVRPGAVARRLALGIAAGALVSAAIMMAWLGVRPDIVAAAATLPFWMKFGYTFLLAAAGMWAVDRLARPAGRAGGASATAAIVVVALAVLALAQLVGSPGAAARRLLLGASADRCPWIIVVLSVPVLIGTLWAMRSLAPTRLGRAGVAAGLMAGALGAWIYAFHCDETTAPFVAVWYTAGIAAVGAIGGVLGRYLLRW
jgi:hypothetical protein